MMAMGLEMGVFEIMKGRMGWERVRSNILRISLGELCMAVGNVRRNGHSYDGLRVSCENMQGHFVQMWISLAWMIGSAGFEDWGRHFVEWYPRVFEVELQKDQSQMCDFREFLEQGAQRGWFELMVVLKLRRESGVFVGVRQGAQQLVVWELPGEKEKGSGLQLAFWVRMHQHGI